jgi:hypothetical protein
MESGEFRDDDTFLSEITWLRVAIGGFRVEAHKETTPARAEGVFLPLPLVGVGPVPVDFRIPESLGMGGGERTLGHPGQTKSEKTR